MKAREIQVNENKIVGQAFFLKNQLPQEIQLKIEEVFLDPSSKKNRYEILIPFDRLIFQIDQRANLLDPNLGVRINLETLCAVKELPLLFSSDSRSITAEITIAQLNFLDLPSYHFKLPANFYDPRQIESNEATVSRLPYREEVQTHISIITKGRLEEACRVASKLFELAMTNGEYTSKIPINRLTSS